MDVSIIMVHYNTPELLEKAIESVFARTTSVEYEIIVVDNGSCDKTADRVRERFGGNITLLTLPENVGFGRANNEAFKISRGRNILFLNPDIVLLNNSIKILSDYVDDHRDTGIAGANLFNSMLEPAYSFRRFLPSLLWEINDLLFAFPEKILFRKDASFNTSGKPLNVAYISGADLMITRDLFEKMGGFDPDYFLYFEETDLACRVRKHHFKILSIPDAQILHIENASFTDKCLAREHYYYGLLTYYSKHYSRIYQWIINLIIKATFITRILLFTVIGGQEKKEYWRMLSGSFYRAKLNYKSQ